MEVLQLLELKLQVRPGRSHGRQKGAWREPRKRLIEGNDVHGNDRTAGQICGSCHAAGPASAEVAHHQDVTDVFAPHDSARARGSLKPNSKPIRPGITCPPWLRSPPGYERNSL
jgi:hypothetical protein